MYNINREELISAVQWDSHGVIPAVAQDANTGATLMLAYMNRESLLQTFLTGYATYWSRSRKRLWKKGETSGHLQRVLSISVDCDGDALLLKVEQTGNACHTGEPTCFYRTTIVGDADFDATFEDIGGDAHIGGTAILREVYDTIADRAENPKSGSYTNYLLHKGVEKICKKLGEEASETIIAAVKGAPEEVRYEAADMIYHLWVLLYQQGLTPEDIYEELANRHSVDKPPKRD